MSEHVLAIEKQFRYMKQSAEVDRSDCNLRLVQSLMQRKLKFRITKSGFRLVKRKATQKRNVFQSSSPVHKKTLKR